MLENIQRGMKNNNEQILSNGNLSLIATLLQIADEGIEFGAGKRVPE
jgi:hypothetical protein